ncbi:type IV pilus modification PilV family protein [Cellulomonas edaphi]|uniref:Type II secretion system protein n=1 Tax=Cellulomonas edaphi TaxID=3053468 RepID=A0ABT7S6I3_9CELL|nr:type II secretion system protein [Cellulomons edaphi]MDM7831227.1 type II secretion system protein [Cellulomons edaphi]
MVVHQQREAQQHDEGFSLIELVIAMIVLGALSLAVIGVILNTQSATEGNRSRVAAANLASREIDLTREQFAASDTGPLDIANGGTMVNQHPLAGGTAGQPIMIDGTPYTVTRSAQWNVTGTGASACEGGSLVSYPTLGITVSVTWPNMGNVKPVESTTALAPDKDTGIQSTDSFVAAKVLDQAAAPLAGISVKAASGATSALGFTDETGCAVIRVNPATTGTAYTVSVNDPTYIDLSGTVNPSRNTGVMLRGSIYSGASFSVAKPGAITVRIVREDGGPLSNAQVAGSSITLVASQYSGSTGATVRTVTGLSTTFSGLWPTTYGAYFGTSAPPGGYPVATLAPGSALTIDVPFAMATGKITNLPVGARSLIAAPAGTANGCTDSRATTFSAGGSADVTLIPGSYDLYVTGDAYTCSPGAPAVAFDAGDNEDFAWAATTLQLTGAPTGGKVWAIERKASGLTGPTTCPTSFSGTAIDISNARSGPFALAAGDWYVWQTNGAVNGSCQSYPDLINPATLLYGQPNVKGWSASPVTLRVTNLNAALYMVVSTSATTCSTTAVSPAPTLPIQGPTATSGATLQVSAPRPASGTVTYNAYVWNKVSGTCTNLGTFVVGPATGSPLSKLPTSTGQVGP